MLSGLNYSYKENKKWGKEEKRIFRGFSFMFENINDFPSTSFPSRLCFSVGSAENLQFKNCIRELQTKTRNTRKEISLNIQHVFGFFVSWNVKDYEGAGRGAMRLQQGHFLLLERFFGELFCIWFILQSNLKLEEFFESSWTPPKSVITSTQPNGERPKTPRENESSFD